VGMKQKNNGNHITWTDLLAIIACLLTMLVIYVKNN
jgi:hypothetical protein